MAVGRRNMCLDPAKELIRLWSMRVTVIPILIGTISYGLEKRLDDLEIGGRVETIQITALLGRLDCWEKFWRLEVTFCPSDSSERPSAGAGVKNSNDNNNERQKIKQVKLKEKNFLKYLRRTRKLLETKLYSRNLVKGINTRTVPHVTYSRQFLKGTREELKQKDKRTRKLMTIHKALHPSDDVDRLCQEMREEDLPALKTALTH